MTRVPHYVTSRILLYQSELAEIKEFCSKLRSKSVRKALELILNQVFSNL